VLYGSVMLGPLAKGIAFAASPTGRKAIRGAARFARSEQGRKLADQAVQAAKQAATTAAKPETRERVKELARSLRQRPQ
jgi:hypothetical protein